MNLKEELKNGTIVECRNGYRGIKIDNQIVFLDGTGFEWLSNYDMNLKPYDCDDEENEICDNYIIDKFFTNNNNPTNSLETFTKYVQQSSFSWTWERSNPILTEKEKEYLSAVIKPFKEHVLAIIKTTKWITIKFNIGWEEDDINLPQTYIGGFKNMKLNTKYTLADLDLELE